MEFILLLYFGRAIRAFAIILLIFSPSLIILSLIGFVFKSTVMFVIFALVSLPINALSVLRGRLHGFASRQLGSVSVIR